MEGFKIVTWFSNCREQQRCSCFMTIHFQHQESGTVKNLLHHFSVFVIVFFFFLLFLSISLFLLFSQTAWSLINLGGFCSMFKKRQLATDKTKILFILKIRTRILMIMAMRYSRSVQILCVSKKSNNGEIIGGEWDRIRVI